MNVRKTGAVFFLIVLTLFISCQSDMPQKRIVSLKPALQFEDAMVSGNGLSGIMQYGDPLDETIVFNSHKFIYPNGAPVPIPDMTDAMGEMQDRFLRGEIIDAWNAYLTELRKRGAETGGTGYESMLWTQSFHPGYDLKIKHKEPIVLKSC